jgi:hypothetical protein
VFPFKKGECRLSGVLGVTEEDECFKFGKFECGCKGKETCYKR